MHDTWVARDLPVLDATVGLLEQSYMVTVTDIAARTGLDAAQVARALEALDPVYVDFRKTTTGGDPRFWYVFKVTPEARRAVGQWPTPESLVSAFAEQLYAASHQATEDQRQTLLAYAARLIGDTVRDLAVAAAARVLAPALGDVALPEPEPLPAPGPEAGTGMPAPDPGDGDAPAAQAAPAQAGSPAAAAEAGSPAAEIGGRTSAAAEAGGLLATAAGKLNGDPVLPDLVPLPEPAPFPGSLAGR